MPSNQPIKVIYTSLPVDVPESFLAPLQDPSTIEVKQIDFENSPLPEYKRYYAVVLDNVLSQEECDQMIHFAELSAGAHGGEAGVENNGWKPAMVNVGNDYEMLVENYRKSDRIIWDEKEVTHRLWQRILQAEGMKEYFLKLEGSKHRHAIIGARGNQRDTWVATKQGINERMRFLKYGAGEFFRPHCDGPYSTPDSLQMTQYTVHLYLNDSAQVLGIPDTDPRLVETSDKPAKILKGGATSFLSYEKERRIDVDPKAGRVLIFQHRGLLHSGDEVIAGIKYTVRSDILYELEAGGKIFK